ncbi:MAG: glycosyltransferase [Flavobacteriales bacterium]|nr:glycosyltransferase [Flavobacteriales bacterium]
MIIYLTYNDQPSGVYWSQVTDVVDHLNSMGPERVKLVALVSLRGYWDTRSAIRQRMPDALVLPMVPRAHNWRINWFWLWLVCLLHGPTGIIGRGVFATALALRMRRGRLVQRVCLDGRGAYGAEWEEYRIVDNDQLIEECARIEHLAVNEADMRIAVSKALIQHWRDRFNYMGDEHVVIPCTLGHDLERPVEVRSDLRSQLGWAPNDLVLVYSGSTVGWQSLQLQTRMLAGLLSDDATIRVLFLSQDDPHIRSLEERFPGRVARRWVPHARVHEALSTCDIGLLVREPSVTNQVASPTKFAEYLSAGLQVLVSEGLGDLATLVRSEKLGWVYADGVVPRLSRSTEADRERMQRVVREHFSKSAFNASYHQLLRCMGPARERYNGHVAVKAHRQATSAHLVSIIVPSYNKGRYIREMVASVQAQTHTDWEMLFIDDGSTDGTRAVITELAATDQRIKLHFQAGNKGANHCRNLGLQLAVGDHIMFFDADDVLAPHCLAGRLAADPKGDFDLVISTMEVFRNVPGEGGNRWEPSAADPLAEFLRHRLPWSVMQPLWRAPFLRSLGGFDETFPRHQDVEFHTRALFHPCVRYLTMVGEPDCFYRIAEERKVLRPYALLEGFTTAALKYYFKFKDQARSTGRHRLLLGIIYQTHIQLVHNRKLGLITSEQQSTLRTKLLDPQVKKDLGMFKRWVLAASGVYNALPVRIPGVNLVFYRLITV